ncbi:MAG: hypothetical protein J2P25_04015 [Nocardiopsaceae bacterium]|nr:hypothetical protein [Nocardiopsaceae bacterium]
MGAFRKGFPAQVQRLVRHRADYRCEACGAWVIGKSGGACLPVVRDVAGSESAGVPADVLAGAANAVLLCAPCTARAEALDPQLEALGFRVRGGGDPRRVPMTMSWDGVDQRTVWRSPDGRYLTEPPA